ncbi:MAG: hypothetical protein NTY48_07435 [Candidatus Diapherotrites archaeon]|nr:hypothetical protein [Candidatus Diapherotrites archaeon]
MDPQEAYANPSKYAYSSKKLTKELESVCINKEILYTKGTTWTIDAPYRETIRKFDKYKKEGVLTVEMEASALFTLCKVRQVECAGVFWVSDQLKRKGWAPSFYTPAYYDGAKKAFRILKGFLEKENKA